MKELVASRIPPGDRWALIESESDIVFGSLTDCLNQIFVVHQATQFVIDAKKGEVYIEDGVDKPQPVKKYSLYGLNQLPYSSTQRVQPLSLSSSFSSYIIFNFIACNISYVNLSSETNLIGNLLCLITLII